MNIIIIGAGLTGLIAAKTCKLKFPNSSITILEKANKVGGILCGNFYHEENLYFDYGTHIYQETGNPELDALLLDSIPKEELIHYEIGKGDICGSYFAGNLQNNSHFPDLRGDNFDNSIKSSLSLHIDKQSSLHQINSHLACLQYIP